MTITDFKNYKNNRDLANKEAEEMIEYIRKNCTQSEAMLDFLDQPLLKDDVSKTLHQFKMIRDQMEKEKQNDK